MMLLETVLWMWLCVSSLTHTLQPVLNNYQRRLETKWIMPSRFDKNWAAWRGSRWAVRMTLYGDSRPATICQLRPLMRHSPHFGTWSSCPSTNYAEGNNIMYLYASSNVIFIAVGHCKHLVILIYVFGKLCCNLFIFPGMKQPLL